MSDLIKRQDAIGEIESLLDKTAKGDIGTFYNKILKLAIEHIEKIPSVQPTADVVEVVRCKNCLHWDDEKDGVYVGNLYHCCDYNGEHKEPYDFCSYGERREDEHTD